jgi:hypothetical protein
MDVWIGGSQRNWMIWSGFQDAGLLGSVGDGGGHGLPSTTTHILLVAHGSDESISPRGRRGHARTPLMANPASPRC